jgi:hypothetical protein
VRDCRHDQRKTSHYFSPRKQMPERDSGFRFRHSPPTVAPGQNCGGAPFRQLALHILSHKDERHRRSISARKFPRHNANSETYFSKALAWELKHLKNPHATQQAWMNSRNLFNIASAFTHRQPVILHHSLRWQQVRAALRGSVGSSTLQVFQIISGGSRFHFGKCGLRPEEGAWEGCVVTNTG